MKYSLYSEKEIKVKPSRKKVFLESYVVGNNAPTVIVCPGGAYKFVSDFNEGKPFAEELNKRGYNAFVLTYSVGSGVARYPNPLEDVARAVRLVRKESETLNINADSFALMGSSAGGHLCSFFSAVHTRFEENDECLKPAALVLAYPVITMGALTHKTSRNMLLGLFSGKTEQRAASVEQLAASDYPPTFVWHNKDDTSVDYNNSVMLKNRLDEVGAECEMHLYETGGHGIGLADGKDAEGWINLAIDFLDRHLNKNNI